MRSDGRWRFRPRSPQGSSSCSERSACSSPRSPLRIEQHLPWLTIVIGVTLIGLGIALVAGRELFVRLPRLARGGRDGTLPSMFLFGMSYAVASLSCTIGPFLAVTTSTFRTDTWLAGGWACSRRTPSGWV
ncbi:MAG: hypothetical protein KatS3mg010_0888 [Acidimicrobiia bacterium]|nr:MAG: hypothetical protein KatS3mg010_0888 [Acidimicrobiia bacterium]